ncbi:glycosyltransferase [Deinococcus metallilatus]|uniref:Glycosyltransferase family 4 protein n=1 Tax=Deinococcus metallilatus TaxID=1211322 RepID=A0AAJ5K3N3_9DEIO|nr:glycosyltransferase family 4 protein [Deinococcus metallilatus]MBB5296810.1 glycosyltransferase involved in cell wall biosynthesis [Deinococcus metallilatus]QBY09550.1 glycosyltransferase [Deinococcus metallilatus]RXJ09154.1 glycosyltransferase [Deinococcus metallilatus]TLK22802.1 glycosyltransferase family 4 protein [Deinococcus metallilatus]
MTSERLADGAGVGQVGRERVSDLRVLGLDLEFITDHQTEFSRNAALYRALDQRVRLVGRTSPTLSRGTDLLNKLLQFRLNLTDWRRNAHFNPYLFRKRTQAAQQYLDNRRGDYDVILQTYLQFAPGTGPGRKPYAVYLDATFEMSRKYYPIDHPLSRRAMAEWLGLERQVYQGAARLFPWSDFAARSLIEDYGCDPRRVVRVGAGTNLLAPSLENKRYDAPVALFVGTQFKRKGGMELLQAFREVRAQWPEAELWIVGPRLPEAPPQPGVRWIGRVRDRQVLADLYAQARLFVMPSFEPWGHVFCEAMGHGLPCVALNVGSTPEIVEEGRSGLLVDPQSPEALAAAMLQLLSDPALAERLGRSAYDRVRQTFLWDQVVGRMVPHLEAMARGEDA